MVLTMNEARQREEQVLDWDKARRQWFWSNCERGDGPDDCWHWKAGKNEGYGSFWNVDGNVYAHRASLTLARQSPLGDKFALHSCSNSRDCINPHHLRAGTHQDNVADALAAGAYARKLTRGAVWEIRNRATTTTQRILAQKFGVNVSTISHVVTGLTWSHVR